MDKNDGAASLVRSDALLATDVLAEMDRIMQERPCAMEYETDARDTWPARWGALRGFLAAKRDIANTPAEARRIRSLQPDLGPTTGPERTR